MLARLVSVSKSTVMSSASHRKVRIKFVNGTTELKKRWKERLETSTDRWGMFTLLSSTSKFLWGIQCTAAYCLHFIRPNKTTNQVLHQAQDMWYDTHLQDLGRCFPHAQSTLRSTNHVAAQTAIPRRTCDRHDNNRGKQYVMLTSAKIKGGGGAIVNPITSKIFCPRLLHS